MRQLLALALLFAPLAAFGGAKDAAVEAASFGEHFTVTENLSLNFPNWTTS